MVRTAEGIPWLSKAGLARLPMLTLFLVCYSAVHLNFERVWWLTPDRDIFGKYEAAAPGAEAIEVAKEVYFTKATWMIALIWMLAAGLSLPAAISWSFALYCAELLVLFPLRGYTALNGLLAVGLVVEQVVERRRARRAPPA